MKVFAQGGKIRIIYHESDQRGTSDWGKVDGLRGCPDCNSDR